MCDPAKGAAGQRTIAVLLPCLLDKGMMSPVTEVRALRCALYLLIKWMDLLSFSHSTEIAFLWVLDSSKYGENELRRIYWGDPRAFVKSSEAEHFLRNKHSHGNLALDQHAAVLLWPVEGVLLCCHRHLPSASTSFCYAPGPWEVAYWLYHLVMFHR